MEECTRCSTCNALELMEADDEELIPCCTPRDGKSVVDKKC